MPSIVAADGSGMVAAAAALAPLAVQGPSVSVVTDYTSGTSAAFTPDGAVAYQLDGKIKVVLLTPPPVSVITDYSNGTGAAFTSEGAVGYQLDGTILAVTQAP